MNSTTMGIAIAAASMVFAGCEPQVGNGSHSVEHVTLETFQIPEVVPNTALDNFEAVRGSVGTLKRSDDRIRVKVNTQDLPDGVYTYWWHLAHDDGEVSILWAGSSIVDGGNGTAHLDSTLPEGEENAPGYIFIGHGLQPGAARTVQVQLWVRDHGELSDDPELAYRQQNRPFGGCTDTRNPLPHNDDYPCWNPQRAVFGN